jgi:hypothetical protein
MNARCVQSVQSFPYLTRTRAHLRQHKKMSGQSGQDGQFSHGADTIPALSPAQNLARPGALRVTSAQLASRGGLVS